MRVLHVVSSLDPRFGGTTMSVLELVLAQADVGMEPSILTGYFEGEDLDFARRHVGPKVMIEAIGPTIGPLRWHHSMKNQVGTSVDRSDIVHIHALWENLQFRAAAAALKKRKPYVTTPCGMLDAWSMAQSGVAKRLILSVRGSKLLDRASLIHVKSADERRQVERWVSHSRIDVMPNGISSRDFRELPPRGEFRRAFLGGFDGPLLLAFGRIAPKKNLEFVIDAMPRLKESSTRLAIVGPSESAYYRDQLTKLASRSEHKGRIVFLEPLHGRDRSAAYLDADALVVPSLQENFGSVVLEALATGTRVVASTNVASGEIVAEYAAGEWLGLDTDKWVASLNSILTTRWSELARSALRARVLEDYDWHAIAKRWDERYKDLSRG